MLTWTPWTKVGWGVMTAGVVLLVLFSARYFTVNPDVYFPRQRAVYEARTVGLLVHIGAMIVAALVGPLQFLPGLRRRWPRVHRVAGRLYLAGATLGALGGLYLAPFAASGWVARLGFALLGLGVLGTTGRGFWAILHRQVQVHRDWMTRSFALILAAVTLRLYSPFLDAVFGEYAGYALVAWACWVPNLFVAEWLIRSRRRRTPARVVLAPAEAVG
jgi:hypothetical protein